MQEGIRVGRPKIDPTAVRVHRVNARLSPSEYALLKDRAAHMGMTPAQWLREAALSRRLPSPPVPAINRSAYAELARLSANLNQLARHANRGESVQLDANLLQKLGLEVRRLRLYLIGAGE
jgi:hypothetical protein